METYHLTSAQDNAVGEYRQIGYMNFEDVASRIIQWGLLVFITIAAAFVFNFLARNLGRLPDNFRIGTREIVVGIITLPVTLVIHEWIHSLMIRQVGARPQFGMTRNNVIATITAPGYGFRRNTIIRIALTPLIVLTGLALLGIWLFQGTPWVALFALIAVINTGSAISDFWLIGILLHYSKNIWTVDDKDGMKILMPME